MDDRKFTDADIDALLDRAEQRVYLNLGKGLWRAFWAVVFVVIVSVAALGYRGH